MIISNVYTVHSDKFFHHNHSLCSVKTEVKRFKAPNFVWELKNHTDPPRMKWIDYLYNIINLVI